MNFIAKVKLGNITNLSDARYAAASGIDYLGFCFDTNNQNYIAPIKAKEVIDWITGCEIVAEFGNQTIEEIQTISELLKADLIELNNQILPNELSQFNKPIIKKIDINNFDSDGLIKEIESYKNQVELFHLFSSKKIDLDEKKFTDFFNQHKIIFGFELNADTIISTINSFKPYAINFYGKDEEKTGYKDFEEMNELLELIRTEN